jgi:cystathionine beta-lyase
MGNALGGIGLSAAYDNGEEWLEELLSYLQTNLDFIVDYFEENLPKVKVIKPEATYMALLDFTAFDLSSEDLKNKLIHEANVVFNEGEMFGEEGKGLQRINFACPRATLEKALGQIVNTFTNL